ncbi:MAG: transglycosylase domain-containing protein [Acidimicrobiia bacterium]
MRTFWRFCAILTLGGVGVGLCFAALIPGAATVVAGNHYTGDVAKSLKPLDERTIVYASDGTEIGKLGRQDRETAKLGEVPQSLIEAVIVTEDESFYTNPGVDLEATIRALAANLGSGDIRQGGSTITQQLIKNRIVGIKQDLSRKMKEAILAFRINANYSKNEILEQYLNTVYFGQGSYGVKAAAERLFIAPDPVTGAPVTKNLSQLTVADSALLAALISNPNGNNPFSNPAGAVERRNLVVQRMLEKGYITPEEAGTAVFTPLPTIPPPAELRPNDYYVQEVQNRIIQEDDEYRFGLGTTESERRNKVLGGGLRIYTALDLRMQAQAEAAMRDTLPEDTNGATTALVAMDPSTGHVLAAANLDRFDPDHQVNIAADGVKQQGSTFKAITLAAALESGFSPDDTINGSDYCDDIPDYAVVGKAGRNSEGGGGTMSLWKATSGSVNCAYLRLQQAVGDEKVAEMAVRMGLPVERTGDPIEDQPGAYRTPDSLTLGTVGATPLEMATAFNTLANDGVRMDPVFITRIEDSDGKLVFQESEPGVRAMSAQTARTATKMLEGVITNGTGSRYAQIDRPAAGKTGSTDEKSNAWFDGFVPQLTAVVWMGHLEDQQPLGRVGEFGSVFGGTYPAKIWHNFMTAALEGEPALDFPQPDESLWASGRFITVKGRGVETSSRPFNSGATTTTVPDVPAPTVPTPTAPPTTPTTAPPPPTTPPTTPTP